MLPFVLQFYSQLSEFHWTDDYGEIHVVHQGEGDALMPLYQLGQHAALQSVQDAFLPREYLLANLDDIYVVCSPERVAPIHKLLEQALEECARIQVHLGKQCGTVADTFPPGCEALQVAAEIADPDARVWKGDEPSHERGIHVLGIPVGHVNFVQAQLQSTTEKHRNPLRTVAVSAGSAERVAPPPFLRQHPRDAFLAWPPTRGSG